MFSTEGFLTSKIEQAVGWARKYSLFQYPFVTACCGMEYMATAASHYDIDRFPAFHPVKLTYCGWWEPSTTKWLLS
jgi:NADH:ubiquinone oxidoreductase subunit B-like Fe-S oxidoreductase